MNLVIVGESKIGALKSAPPPTVFHTATINNNYGMAIMLHPRYANRDIKVPNSSPYHVQLFFDNFDILGIYVPSGIKVKVAFLISKFGKFIGPNTIVVGDFIMELNEPKSHADHALLDYLFIMTWKIQNIHLLGTNVDINNTPM